MQAADDEPGCPFLFNDGTDNMIPIAVHYDGQGNRIYRDTPDQMFGEYQHRNGVQPKKEGEETKGVGRGSNIEQRREQSPVIVEHRRLKFKYKSKHKHRYNHKQKQKHIPEQQDRSHHEQEVFKEVVPAAPIVPIITGRFYTTPTARLMQELQGADENLCDADDEDETSGGSEDAAWQEVVNQIDALEMVMSQIMRLRCLAMTGQYLDQEFAALREALPPGRHADMFDPSKCKTLPENSILNVWEQDYKRELDQYDEQLMAIRQEHKGKARRFILRWYKARLQKLREIGSQGDFTDMSDLHRRAMDVLTTRDRMSPESEACSSLPPRRCAPKTVEQFTWRIVNERVVKWVMASKERPPSSDGEGDQFEPEDDDEPVYRPFETDEDIYEKLGYPIAVLEYKGGGVRRLPPELQEVKDATATERSKLAPKPAPKPTHSYNLRGKRKWVSEDNDSMTRGN